MSEKNFSSDEKPAEERLESDVDLKLNSSPGHGSRIVNLANGYGKPEMAVNPAEILLTGVPLKAAGFIVTVYGDVVEPRGGTVWIGNLIETCQTVGITETLVRTAVSRLVSAGRLSGEREGRRSYYRLTNEARAEFTKAADLIYGQATAARWQFILVNGPSPEDVIQSLERDGFSKLGPRVAVGTHRPPNLPSRVVVFEADVNSESGALSEFAKDAWDLQKFAKAFEDFLARFKHFFTDVANIGSLPPIDCLTLRLILVHQYRLIMLRAPQLPRAALPSDWPGERARTMFAQLYAELSPGAEEYVGGQFLNDTGNLPRSTEASRLRMSRLLKNSSQ